MASGEGARAQALTATVIRKIGLKALTVAGVASLVALTTACFAGNSGVVFTPEEKALILSHGPWPPAVSPDPSNRFSGKPDAIALGRLLFFERRLSSDGTLSCASCHQPARAMTDGLSRGVGRQVLDRNTQVVANLANRRWYGWIGQSDTLWGQSVRPIVDQREMASSSSALATTIRTDSTLAMRYAAVTGQSPESDSEETILVNVAKSLAAWQETVITPRTAFDQFRDALAEDRDVSEEAFSQSARRGLKLFVGDGRCSFCHFGPNFSNDEFHHIGLEHFIEDNRVDPGRHGGLSEYLRSPYNRIGPFSDESEVSAASAPGNFVTRGPDDWGRFRAPSLRNVGGTAPYMHDGSLPDLASVVAHYNDIPEDRLHSQGESLLQRLDLTPAQLDDIVAFLQSLDGDPVVSDP